MDLTDSKDWLQELNHQMWAARIRQLRQELRQEQDSQAQKLSALKFVEPTTEVPKQPTRPAR
jgi:hypothetical protein